MKNLVARHLHPWLLLAMLGCTRAPGAQADPIPVHHIQGTLHGFLEMRSEAGLVVASGDITQVVHGDQITSQTLFRFKDGSIDDEVTVFSQRRTFQLISDHRIQKGPYFPHPMDMLVDARTGQVTVRSQKNGKEDVKTDHIDLPPDIANGLVPLAIENIPANAPETTLSMIVATPKPRLVKLAITPAGENTCSVSVSRARRSTMTSRSSSAASPASSRR